MKTHTELRMTLLKLVSNMKKKPLNELILKAEKNKGGLLSNTDNKFISWVLYKRLKAALMQAGYDTSLLTKEDDEDFEGAILATIKVQTEKLRRQEKLRMLWKDVGLNKAINDLTQQYEIGNDDIENVLIDALGEHNLTINELAVKITPALQDWVRTRLTDKLKEIAKGAH